LAQLVERYPSKIEVTGSIPVEAFLFLIFYLYFFYWAESFQGRKSTQAKKFVQSVDPSINS
jgi:uncharacterized protein (DUF2062 family)